MAFEKAIPTGGVSHFKSRMAERVRALARESEYDEFVMPVALLLAVDKANGGDGTADEIQRRFFLLDAESRDVLDFYFVGWHRADSADPTKGLAFDVLAFASIRDALREAGIAEFGGYADLILLDARYKDGRAELDFRTAIHVDLADAVKNKKIASVASFLEALVDSAHRLRDQAPTDPELGKTWWISDRLGLAIAKKSVLQYILETWGKIIGADKIATIVVRRAGPSIDLAAFGSPPKK